MAIRSNYLKFLIDKKWDFNLIKLWKCEFLILVNRGTKNIYFDNFIVVYNKLINSYILKLGQV